MTPGRVPALDGLRGIAIFSVVMFHLRNSQWGIGWAGVDLFFVLSGFLIGGQLLDLKVLDGAAVRGFYIRRAFRILPLYLLLLGVVAAARVAGYVEAGGTEPGWLLAALMQNAWYGTGGDGGYIQAATWSLAVEEHFYLLLPAVLLLLRRRYVPILCIAVIVAALAFRFGAFEIWGRPGVYYLTPSRIDGPMAGVLLAWCTRRYTIDVRWAGLAAIAGAGALFIAVLVFGRLAVMASPWSYLLTSAASAGAVVLATSPSWLSVQLAESRALQWLGTRAYGVYLAHYGLIRGMEGLDGPAVNKGPAALIGAVLALLLAELLWRTVEAPMIAAGKKMSISWEKRSFLTFPDRPESDRVPRIDVP